MLQFISELKTNHLLNEFIVKETPFQIQKVLGNGSYGIAYLLVQKETGVPYVLKRLRAKHRKDTHQILKFKQEISMLKQLDLPNIPKIHYEGELVGIPFYIMDYIDGHTFEQKIFNDGNSFSLKESFFILEKLFDVVICIHDQQIVHRDLRIPNILIKNDTVYIIDFGLASYIKNNDILKVDNPKKIEDHRSDLYYIGHFLLYLLYSNYLPTSRKERSWQEELQLPQEVEEYIERLLLIRPAFSSAKEALHSMPQF